MGTLELPAAVREGIDLLARLDTMFDVAPASLEALRNRALRGEAEELDQGDPRLSALILAVSMGHMDDSVGRHLAESRARLGELRERLSRRTETDWATGRAARFLDPLDIGLLAEWERQEPVPVVLWLVAPPGERREVSARCGTFARWLEGYLHAQPPDASAG